MLRKKLNSCARAGVFGPALLFLLGLVVATALPPRARAGSLDEAVLFATDDILDVCRTRGWKNIGVLKFRVEEQKKKGRPTVSTWNEGRLNTYMARRLENSLLLAGKGKIAVTRSASEEAIKRDRNISWANADGRKKLLSFAYPMVVGDKSAKVDAFLTGVVTITPDFKKMKVVILGWDNKNLEPREVTTFETRTDRSALIEMNRSFVIKRATALSLVKSRAELDDAASNDIDQGAATNNSNAKPLSEYVDFQLVYDDQPVAIEQGADSTRFKAQTPQPGQKVLLRISGKERLAVVILVNGVNTYLKESGREPTQYSRWVLEQPNRPYTIAGFYPDSKTVEPFKVVADDQNSNITLADETKRGLIEVFVFREGKEPETSDQVGMTLRGFNLRAKTYQDAIKRLKANMRNAPTKKGLLIPDPNQQAASVQETDFQNPQLVASQVVEYYKK
jgi:hypothetical protein